MVLTRFLEKQAYRLPWQFVALTLLACLLPLLLNLLGVDFGIVNLYPVFEQVGELVYESQQAIVHRFLRGNFIHVILELISIITALLTAILCFVEYGMKKDISTPIIGVALFCAGMLDVFHVLVSARLVSVGPDWSGNIDNFSWLISRCYHALILMMGTGIFLVSSQLRTRQETERKANTYILYISLIFVLLSALTINIIFRIDGVSELYNQNPRITQLLNNIPLVLYLVSAAFILPRFIRKYPSIFSQMLLLSLVPAIFAQLCMVYGSAANFDNYFNIAHYEKFVTYLIPFLGISLNYQQMHRTERLVIRNLNEEAAERKKAEDLVNGVLNSSISGIIAFRSIRNEEGKIIDFAIILANPSASRYVIGHYDMAPNRTVEGSRMSEIFSHNFKDGLFDKYVDVVENNSSFRLQHNSSAIAKWLYITGVRFQDGLVITFDDITERKLAEERIQHSESLYRSFAKNMPSSLIFLFDKELNCTLADGSAFDMLKLKREDFVGRKFADTFDKYYMKLLLPLFERTLEGEESSLEVKMRGMLFKVHNVPIRNTDGEIFAGMCVAQDITDVKNYEKELKQHIEELNNSNRELEQFAYVASHDLQEPLRKIRAFGDRLISKYMEAIGEDGRNYIERMQNASARMQKLIDDLLTFSRISRTQEPFEPVDLNKVVLEVLNDLEIAIESKGVQVHVDPLPVINARTGQIRQLFQNLISNAIKFSRDDLPPEIHINSQVPDPEKKSDKRIKITIRDNGIGFDEKYAEKIFVIFQRLHGKTEYEGTGIGLAICKRIIENHNGSITAYSHPGEGATFEITLPLKHDRNS
ncbi:PAS domain S-box-containing protein [Anseongella ginsenosidimutans]|uniref:histidine kinase n=2 Tax=Anseongella ginsenosidimutans TaxID=496056 RepID=A0A4V2UU57_9SPHI|nr:PAS domain S-box-containing protein [Anseongella ginsenosidimutans]